MAEPVKVKFEYKNPKNVEAEVPGDQKLREESEIKHDTPKKEVPREMRHGNKSAVKKNGEGKDNIKPDDKKAKTKIPVSHLRQTVEKLKARRRGSKELKEKEAESIIRRSSLPKQTKTNAPIKPARKSISVTPVEIVQPEMVQDDDFDKLYEEVVQSTPTPINIDVSLLDPKVDDPENLESKFEEIIHDYDENRVQPIDVEKIKKSKIPFFKRKSQPELNVGDRSGKMIAARDRVRMRHHSAKSDDSNYVRTDETISNGQDGDETTVEQEEPVELTNNNIAVDEKVSETPNTQSEETSVHTETIEEPLDNNEKDRQVFGITIMPKMEPHDKDRIREENISKNYIKVGIPVFDSYVYENKEKDAETKVEVKDEPSYILDDSLSIEKDESSEEVIKVNNEPVILDEINNSKPNMIEEVELSETTNTTPILVDEEQNVEQNDEINETENAIDPADKSLKLETSFKVIEINNEPTQSEIVDNTKLIVETSETSLDSEPVLSETVQEITIDQYIDENETKSAVEVTNEPPYTHDSPNLNVDNFEGNKEDSNEQITRESPHNTEQNILEAVNTREASTNIETTKSAIEQELNSIDQNVVVTDNNEINIDVVEANDELLPPERNDDTVQNTVKAEETIKTTNDTDPVFAVNEEDRKVDAIVGDYETVSVVEVANEPPYTDDCSNLNADKFEANKEDSNEQITPESPYNTEQNILEAVNTREASINIEATNVVEANDELLPPEGNDDTVQNAVKAEETIKTSNDTEPVSAVNEEDTKVEVIVGDYETVSVVEVANEPSYTHDSSKLNIDKFEANEKDSNEQITPESAHNTEQNILEAVDTREASINFETTKTAIEQEINSIDQNIVVTDNNEINIDVVEANDELLPSEGNDHTVQNTVKAEETIKTSNDTDPVFEEDTKVEVNAGEYETVSVVEVANEYDVPEHSDPSVTEIVETRENSFDTVPSFAEKEPEQEPPIERNVTEDIEGAKEEINEPSNTHGIGDQNLDHMEVKIKIVEVKNELDVTDDLEPSNIEIVETRDISYDFEPVEAENTQEMNKEHAIEINEEGNEVTGDFKIDNDDNKIETIIDVTEINKEIADTERNLIQELDTIQLPIAAALVLAESKHDVENKESTDVTVQEEEDRLEITTKRVDNENLINEVKAPEPVKAHSNDFGNDLPKKKSVLSKIAMFERNENKPEMKSKIPMTNSKIPNTFHKPSNNVHVHTPLIVDEVFKPFDANTDRSASKNNLNDKDEDDIVRAKMVLVESPETVQFEIEDKTQIEPNTMFIQHSTVAEEPMPIRYEPKRQEQGRKGILKDRNDTPVVVPKFIPVREALKRYESLKTDIRVNKPVENLPRTKPIREIIKTLKPENPRSLDTMFAHQAQPVNDILKDIKPETHRDKTYRSQKSHGDFNKSRDEIQRYDKTKHGFKSFKSGGYDYKTFENEDDNFKTLKFIQDYNKSKNDDLKRAKSAAELDLGDAVRGKVSRMIVRINSMEKLEMDTKEVPINLKEKPIRRSVSEKIALFERKSTATAEFAQPIRQTVTGTVDQNQEEITPDIQAKIAELTTARLKYGKISTMPRVQLANGVSMPVIAVGTALLDPRLAYHIVTAAIDLGYRAIDTAFIYGNEKVVGEAINAKINDGTVTREELFIMSKLWSTFHRTDLVVKACEASLKTLGLDYFDLFLIHNPMSLKEGSAALPRIATVLQYSEWDYLDAWFGMEALGTRVRALGVSNFNSTQIKRVLDRARVKPVVNQVECHPYLSQQKLDDFCQQRNVSLNCFGVLGSKGTPAEYKNSTVACIDDPLVQVMASGLKVSPAQLLIRYQFECGHSVVVKASSAAHLWDNLQALTFNMTSAQIEALHVLNRNKRTFTFNGMGETHKNYPFNTLF